MDERANSTSVRENTPLPCATSSAPRESLRLHLAEPCTDEHAAQLAREESIARLIVILELIGSGPLAALLEDLERYGIEQERRWLMTILACRRGRV